MLKIIVSSITLLVLGTIGCSGAKTPPTQPVLVTCAKENCQIYALFNSGKKVKIEDYPSEPSWKFIDSTLVEVVLSCGSPCSYSIFVDVKREKISSPLFNPLAVNSQRRNVALFVDSLLVIQDLFNDKKKCAKRLFIAPVAVLSSAIERAEFLVNGDLVVEYLRGEEFEKALDTIPVCW